jgi:nucleoside transporter
VAGVAGLVLGVYAFTLPHRAPPLAGTRATAREILGIDALRLLGGRSFNVFIAASLLVSIPLAAYYAYAPVFVNAAGLDSPAFRMSFGQMSEVVFMLAMPFFFARLGVKWMLLVGMLAWVTRYALFALAAPDAVVWMIMAGIVLHGVCYDFFFVTGQIYVDRKAPPAIRAQAQGFLVLITYGVGMLIGTQIAGWVFNDVVGEAGGLDRWQSFWWIPAAFALAVATFFGVAFRDEGDAAAGHRAAPAPRAG